MLDFLKQFQLSLMLFLSGSCGVLALLSLLNKTLSKKRKQAMVLMETEAMFLLIFDRLAYAYRGVAGSTGYYMVRISNFAVFFITLLLVHSFNLYLIDLYKYESALKRIPKRLLISEALMCLGIIFLIISQFTGLYYTFDEFNNYHRAPGIYISFIFPILITMIQLSAVIKYRSFWNHYVIIPIILFAILPYIATVVQFFLYGLSLANITIVGVVVLLYIFEVIKINKMQEAKLKAERASNAKSRFLANMSHEIRTPINTIMGMNEMILREDATGVPKPYFMSVMNYAFDIANASETLLSLVNDILDISKIESGKMHLVEQEYDIEEELRNIIKMIRIKSNQKDLTFDLAIDENLPTRMYGDVGKIKQVVLNLLTNAVKYTEKGGFTLKVKVMEKSDDTCKIRFSVKDTGIGVRPEDMDKLFSAFERLDEERNCSIQGTGLGLDISRQFAELMGGRVWCDSVYGMGSEFSFELDQKVIDKEPIGEFDENIPDFPKGPYLPRFVAPNVSILIVDDNVMNLSVTRELLRQTKMKVDTASGGQQALQMIDKHSYDLILLDHMMPDMDGIETAGRIREKNKTVPIIALTANYSSDAENFYKNNGFDDYISKPLDGEILERKIRSHLPDNAVTDSIITEVSTEGQELPEDMLWIKDIEGITAADGIRNSGGVRPYIFSLLLFYETIDENQRVIMDAYNSQDMNLFAVKVHGLKTSARIVGAGALCDMSQKMEDAAKAGNTDYIRDNLAELMGAYEKFKTSLSRLYAKSGDIGAKRKMINSADLTDAYRTIREYAQKMDYDSVETVLDQIKEFMLAEADAFLMAEIEKSLRALDFNHITEILKDK